MRTYPTLIILTLVLLGAVSFFVYRMFFVTAEVITSDNSFEIEPRITYEDAYNGPLYLTGEKVGDNTPWELWRENLDRNGVAAAIAYFGIEAENRLFGRIGVNRIINVVKNDPGRLVPFYSTGIGGEDEGQISGSELVDMYALGYEIAQNAAPGLLQGIGEVELQDWPMPHNDLRVLELIDFASERNLAVMYHVRPGQSDAVADLASRYPDTIFLIHLFPNDFDVEGDRIIEVMRQHRNIYYTLDADHLLFDTSGGFGVGLLYKYEDVLSDDIKPSRASVVEAAEKFNNDFDKLEDVLLSEAVARFGPLVRAFPDRVTVGTELNLRYGYEPASYDRIIKHLRRFIGNFDEDIQRGMAYENAQRVFGSGLSLE